MKAKKALALLIVLAMCFASLPAQIFAVDAESVTFTALDGTSNNDINQGYTKLLDDSFSSKWCDKIGTEEGKSYTPYIVFKASKKIIVSSYTFMTGNDTREYPGRNPKDWTLYGCNDYNEETKSGGSWTAIHTVTDDTVMQNLNKTSYTFNIDGNTSDYQYYKLVITANHGAQYNLIQLTRMTLGYTVAKYVTFDKNGGDTEAAPNKILSGNGLPTTEPTKADNAFLGWYTMDGTDGNWGELFTAGTSVTSDTTVYARWTSSNLDCLDSVTLTALSGTAGNTDESYDKLVDGEKIAGSFTKWCVKNFEGANVILRASAYTVPTGYILTTGNDTKSQPGRNPKDWVLYGSNDYNETKGTGTWTALHTITNDTVLEAKNFTSYSYNIENTKAYKYFKLEISAIQSGTIMQLCEFELTGRSCAHSFGTPQLIAPTCTEIGRTLYTCNSCGLFCSVNELPANGHTGENGICTVCKEDYGVSIGDTYYADLYSAIAAANENSENKTLKLRQDFDISQSLVFDLSDAPYTLDLNGYTIKADGTNRVILANGDLIITDSSTAKTGTITGGYASDNGGGIFVNKTLTINGGTITNCSAAINGGAVYLNGSDRKLIMNGGTITGCSAASDSYLKGGGAVFCATDSVLELNGGTITGCTAQYGAGIYNYAGNVSISGGNVSNNTASCGGALYTAGGNVNITGGIISGNHASEGGGAIRHAADLSVASVLTMNGGEISGNNSGFGGGIYVEMDAAFTLNSGVIKNNSVSHHGGGIYNWGTTVINGGTISGNYADLGGGGILNSHNPRYGYLSTLTITGGEIKNNTAGKSTGGGIYLSSGNVEISNATIKDNTAKKQGGGIYYDGTSLTMTGCTISGNTGYGGGGICLYGDITGTLNNCIISGNTATNSESGGGILADKGATLNLNGGEVKNNTAGGNGGGISAYSKSTINISGTPVVSGNSAVSQGGGIQLAFNSKLNMTGGTVENNRTTGKTGEGGGIELDTSVGTISNVLVRGNSSSSLAGGINADASTVTLENTQITENTATRGGGLATYESSSITVKGGKIFKNNASQGAGLRIGDDSSVTLQDGAEISENGSKDGYYNNNAIFGGGVWISKSTLNLNGANIINNHAENGGGIYTYDSDVALNLSDGSITGNTAFFESAGIASKTNNIIIKGGVQITGNKKTATDTCHIDSNVYLRNGTTLQVENPITQTADGIISAQIGVHVEAGNSNVVAANDTDYRQYFTTDSAGGTLTYDTADKMIKLGGECTVTYDCGNGTVFNTVTKRNMPTSEPENIPKRDGYYFGGWELDYDMYDFSSKVTKDIVLKAKWLEAGKLAVSVTPGKIYIVSEKSDTMAYIAAYQSERLTDTAYRAVKNYTIIDFQTLKLNLLNADTVSLFIWDSNFTPLCQKASISLN